MRDVVPLLYYKYRYVVTSTAVQLAVAPPLLLNLVQLAVAPLLLLITLSTSTAVSGHLLDLRTEFPDTTVQL